MARAFIVGCLATELSSDEKAFYRDADPWGLILFKRNVADVAQLSRLTADFRAAVVRADAPVFIDQEGGRVQRMAPPNWRAYPAAAKFEGSSDGAGGARAAWLTARLIAEDLRAVGITANCAPVLDVADEATHAVIGSRAFSKSPATVAKLARAYLQGLNAGGVAGVVKHIPGHGRTRVDSHLELPVVDASREDLEAHDFAPFAALKDAPMAMSAHIVFTAIDNTGPATTSAKIVKDIMRGAIGYDGLIISDDLSMKALSGTFAEKTRALFAAGLDIALHCNGDRSESEGVAANSPVLSGKSLERAERGMAATRGKPDPIEAAELEKELASYLA